jgi:hypothetical protein
MKKVYLVSLILFVIMIGNLLFNYFSYGKFDTYDFCVKRCSELYAGNEGAIKSCIERCTRGR